MSALSALPHVVKAIKLRWGQPVELEEYLTRIMILDLTSKKRGFTMEVFKELMKIQDAHRILFGEHVTSVFLSPSK